MQAELASIHMWMVIVRVKSGIVKLEVGLFPRHKRNDAEHVPNGHDKFDLYSSFYIYETTFVSTGVGLQSSRDEC